MIFSRWRRLPALGVGLVALACGGGDGGGTGPCTPGQATQLVQGGNQQQWYFGNPLPTPYSVTALDASSCPVPGIVVNWAIASGGGTVSSAQGTTNASGVASTVHTLGPAATTQDVTATPTGAPGLQAVTFHAFASAPPPTAAVSLASIRFNPSNVVVQVNTGTAGVGDVTWTWNDNPTSHNVTFTAGPTPRPANSDTKATGTYVATFTTVGTYNYTCTLHGGMNGTVTVVH
jgi:plastocyanin